MVIKQNKLNNITRENIYGLKRKRKKKSDKNDCCCFIFFNNFNLREVARVKVD